MTIEDVVDEIVDILVRNRAIWGMEDYNDLTARLVIYLQAVRMFEARPFADPKLQERVVEFLDKKLHRISEEVISSSSRRLLEAMRKMGE